VGPRIYLVIFEKEKCLAPTGIRSPDRSDHSLVAVPNLLIRLLIIVLDDK